MRSRDGGIDRIPLPDGVPGAAVAVRQASHRRRRRCRRRADRRDDRRVPDPCASELADRVSAIRRRGSTSVHRCGSIGGRPMHDCWCDLVPDRRPRAHPISTSTARSSTISARRLQRRRACSSCTAPPASAAPARPPWPSWSCSATTSTTALADGARPPADGRPRGRRPTRRDHRTRPRPGLSALAFVPDPSPREPSSQVGAGRWRRGRRAGRRARLVDVDGLRRTA